MSCADVCLSLSDYDCGPEWSADRRVRAAKPHRCCECGEAIATGDVHEVVVGRWDGEFNTYRTCAACVEVRAAFCCGGWIFGELWESVRAELFPRWEKNLMGVECLAKLETDEAVAKMRAKYAAWAVAE